MPQGKPHCIERQVYQCSEPRPMPIIANRFGLPTAQYLPYIPNNIQWQEMFPQNPPVFSQMFEMGRPQLQPFTYQARAQYSVAQAPQEPEQPNNERIYKQPQFYKVQPFTKSIIEQNASQAPVNYSEVSELNIPPALLMVRSKAQCMI